MKFNKLTIGLTLVGLLCCASAVKAQQSTISDPVAGATEASTTDTNSGWTLLGLFQGNVGSNLLATLKTGVGDIENAPTNPIITIEAGALYGERTHAMGGFLNVYVPIGGTNSLFGAGIGLAYFQHDLYDTTVNGRIGDTIPLPIVHWPLYVYGEAGGGYNFATGRAIAQAFTGALFKIPLSKKVTITLGAAYGTISDYDGQVLAAGGSLDFEL